MTCTILNTARQPSLTLVKEVVNDDGGSAEPTDWTLEADGPTPLSGVSGDPAVTGADVEVGAYALSETGGPAGYEASDWTCEVPGVDGGTATPVAVSDGTVQVDVGQTVVCTVVNDDVPAPFTVVKSSEPGSGATVLPGDVITYTVTVATVGEGFDPDVVITDDLAEVLSNATLVEGTVEPSTGGVVLTGTTLVWTVGDLVGTETITYQVRVDDGAYGVALTNVVTAPGAEPCVEPEPPVEPEAAPGGPPGRRPRSRPARRRPWRPRLTRSRSWTRRRPAARRPISRPRGRSRRRANRRRARRSRRAASSPTR